MPYISIQIIYQSRNLTPGFQLNTTIRSLLRANFKNIIYQTVAQIIPRAMLFLFGFYLAKSLGAVEYGKYDFALSFGYLIGVFFELGGNVILTKYIARGHYSSFKFSIRF